MDKIKRYERQSIRLLIPCIIVGLVLLYAFYYTTKVKPLDPPPVPVMLSALWLLMYIKYSNLRTKIEILKELEKERAEKELK